MNDRMSLRNKIALVSSAGGPMTANGAKETFAPDRMSECSVSERRAALQG